MPLEITMRGPDSWGIAPNYLKGAVGAGADEMS